MLPTLTMSLKLCRLISAAIWNYTILISNVENFYSNYEVKKEDDNNTRISTINTFLDGKKPD